MKALQFFLVMLAAILLLNSKAYAQSNSEVLNLLVKKNVITQVQADSILTVSAKKQQENDVKRKWFPLNASKAFQLGGYIQVRYQFDEAKGKKDGFDFRRGYLNFNGNISPRWSYRFNADIAGAPKLVDAWAEYKLNEMFSVLVGQAAVPFSIENIYSNTKLEFVDRSQVTEALVHRGKDVIGSHNGRDLGVQIGGNLFKINDNYLVEYKIGLLNGSGMNTPDKNESKDVSARVVLHPLKGFGIGASFYDGVGTHINPVQNKGRNRLGFEFNYENTILNLRSEYIQGKDGSIKREGYYVHGGVFLIAQKLQLMGKWDVYDSDSDLSGNRSDWYIAGINYWFNPAVKVQVNYTLKQEETVEVDNNLAAIQLQVAF